MARTSPDSHKTPPDNIEQRVCSETPTTCFILNHLVLVHRNNPSSISPGVLNSPTRTDNGTAQTGALREQAVLPPAARWASRALGRRPSAQGSARKAQPRPAGRTPSPWAKPTGCIRRRRSWTSGRVAAASVRPAEGARPRRNRTRCAHGYALMIFTGIRWEPPNSSVLTSVG